MPIQPQLDQITADLLPTLPQPLQDLVEEGYQEILAQDLEAPAKKVGDRAPAFTLPNTEGEDRSLADTLASDMAIVVFFRGIWCPYCVAYLQALEANLSAFEAAGGQLLVITPQTREYAAKTKADANVSFDILSDNGNHVAAAFGIKTQVPEAHLETLRQFDMSLDKVNGSDGKDTLPLPSSFVIDKTGTIIWSFVNRDYRKRGEPTAILDALKQTRSVAAE